jgi:hypothetical protein
MCRFTHLLATIGTLSWPRSVQRPPAEPFGGHSWSVLESSDGRDCRFGSIRWPRPQKVIPTATYGRA